jgi:hypothetical protein
MKKPFLNPKGFFGGEKISLRFIEAHLEQEYQAIFSSLKRPILWREAFTAI